MDINKASHKAIVLLLLIYLIGCNSAKKDEVTSYMIKLDKKDTFYLGSKATIKIYSIDSSVKICKAYFDCLKVSDRYFNKKTLTISNCEKELFIHMDTVIIQFQPTKSGLFYFNDICLIVKENRKEYYLVDTTFSYSVSK